MTRLRISAISYLNTAPLMWDFEHGSAGRDFEISYTVPSRCAAQLAEGSADIGIIPVAAYASIPGLIVLPGVAIAARRAVRSILLVSRVPAREIRSVALDTSSLTSVALLKVMFARHWKSQPAFAAMPPDLNQMLSQHDAGLLIGDPALGVDRSRYVTYDLAEEWARLTGKPFVFAVWAVREAALTDAAPGVDLAEIFRKSRDHGLDNVPQIAQQWAPRVGLSPPEARAYLTDNIYYYLDAPCLEGLRLFYRYAVQHEVLPAEPGLNFLEFAKPTSS
jgi:chorismate dehydratase